MHAPPTRTGRLAQWRKAHGFGGPATSAAETGPQPAACVGRCVFVALDEHTFVCEG